MTLFKPLSHRTSLAIALLALSVVVLTGPVQAQSGSRPGAAPSSTSQAKVGLEGYCPVCIIEMKQWVKGNPAIQATYDGTVYYFPGEEQKQMFVANPAKYVPALGGNCAVCLANMGKTVPGSIHHAMFKDNRLFLFPGDEQMQEFKANPDKYAYVDLAMGGKCPVCKVEMNKDVDGVADFSEVYHNRRYLFPGAKQQEMFRANPAKYALPDGAPANTAGSSTK